MGIAISKKFLKSFISFDQVHERLCHIRQKGTFRNLSVVCFCAPTANDDDEVKDLLYDSLDQLTTNLPN